jgi:hypothetical protein
MPRLLKDFPATEPGSLGTYSIDFATTVPPGATLVGASWTLGIHAVQPGGAPDAMPRSRLVGGTQIEGTVSLQRIGGLVAGNDYLVSVTGTTSDGEVIVLWTVLPCRAPQ